MGGPPFECAEGGGCQRFVIEGPASVQAQALITLRPETGPTISRAIRSAWAWPTIP